jgi:hypothetical protein
MLITPAAPLFAVAPRPHLISSRNKSELRRRRLKTDTRTRFRSEEMKKRWAKSEKVRARGRSGAMEFYCFLEHQRRFIALTRSQWERELNKMTKDEEASVRKFIPAACARRAIKYYIIPFTPSLQMHTELYRPSKVSIQNEISLW